MTEVGPQTKVLLAGCYFSAGMGGISRVARLTGRALTDAGCNVEALSLLDDKPAHDLPFRTRLAHGSYAHFLASCWRAAFDHNSFIYDQLGPARAHPRLPGLRRPCAVWLHGVEVWEGARRDRLAAARRADLLLCNSRYTRQRAVALHGELFGRASVCWLATEEDEPPSEPPLFDGPPTVLILARIDEDYYKGHRELLACWPKVVAAVPDACLLIVGAGPRLESVRAEAARSPVAANIEVTGFVPEDRIESIWRRAHVLAMPSRGEGFGLVYIEAMRRGLPVIASIHDAGQEVNVDGVTGYNVDLERPNELADRMIHLLRNPDHAAKLGLLGQAHWKTHFRYSAFCQRFVPLVYHWLIHTSSRASTAESRHAL